MLVTPARALRTVLDAHERRHLECFVVLGGRVERNEK
jgi:hypothetical protein